MQGFVGKHRTVWLKLVSILKCPDDDMGLSRPIFTLITQRATALPAITPPNSAGTDVYRTRLPGPFNLMVKPSNPGRKRGTNCLSTIAAMAIGDKFWRARSRK